MSFFLLLSFVWSQAKTKIIGKEEDIVSCHNTNKLNFLQQMIIFSFLSGNIDEENIPVKTVVEYAGRNLTLPCPGVNEHSLIDTLTWKTTQTIAKYVNGMPMVQNQRVSKPKLSSIEPYVIIAHF
jgi:hypothetical protein